MVETSGWWKYTDSVSEARRAVLAAPGSYSQMIQLAVGDARVVGMLAQPGMDPGLTDCVQPIFTLTLAKSGDALFNGPFGYRAQCWTGAESGLAANAALLAALAPKLLGSIDPKTVPELAKVDACASVAAASAKIWIMEIRSLLANPTKDLAVERWVAEADKGVALARWGLCAPVVSRLR